MKNIWQVAICASILLLSLGLPRLVDASRPADRLQQQNDEIIGIASDALTCLAASDNPLVPRVGEVKLNWEGQAEQAHLIVTVSGAEAAHTIKINGQPVAQTPIHPGGQLCGDGEESQSFYLNIPVSTLVQGNNRIELTNDAQSDDSWSAGHVRLIVSGKLVLDIPDAGQIGPENIIAAASVFTASFPNTYDGSSQQFMGQIPTSYDPDIATPLFVAVHGRSGGMDNGVNAFGTEANNRGWLLASPELHGNWPSSSSPQPPNPGAYAYASVQAQYDIVGAVTYMVNNYNVDPNRIYLYGTSMGAMTGAVTVAKFPHLFAAFFDNKGPTDWTEWYYETVDLVSDGYSSQNTHRQWMERECYSGVNTPQDPTENPFCFQRRSGFSYASNLIHTPISNTHSVNDILVPIHHSRELRDAINSYGPDQLASLYEDTVVGPTCPQTNMSEPSSYYHCYEPDDTAIFNFLEQHTLNNNPSHINIVTDQSNSFYWLNLVQTGAPHFSRVQAAYNLANKTVTATIVDTSTLTVAFNLGSTPITNIIDQPGMGLPATTYLVKFPGSSTLKNYTSGYLTTTLTTTGQFSLTISAITPQVSASPPNIPNNGLATSIVTVIVKDQLNQAVPNGTPVQFSTTLGTFPNGTSADTANVSGGAGQAQIVLRAGLTPGVAQVVATVGTASGGTSVTVGSVSVYLPIVIRN